MVCYWSASSWESPWFGLPQALLQQTEPGRAGIPGKALHQQGLGTGPLEERWNYTTGSLLSLTQWSECLSWASPGISKFSKTGTDASPYSLPFLALRKQGKKNRDSIWNKKNPKTMFQSHSEPIHILEQWTFSVTKEHQQQVSPWNKVVVLPSVTHFQHKLLPKMCHSFDSSMVEVYHTKT